ncbi:type IV secretory system conjugative DNA transfer family protein [Rhodospirillum sp. A1_3_36]|uniref:type IV secretory system conjugative DNA transfer family protein n=1 Tax=Rhodospirillum sp. A1_3_36 TaxID=3391666 RepID=UPI0039A5B94B
MSSSFNARFRFGSAAWATGADLARAGLLDGPGLPIGHWVGRQLRLDGDAPMITIGGAGSVKLRDLLAYVVCDSPGARMMVLDPRGELAAISLHVHAPRDEDAWCWNPLGLAGATGPLPHHPCNPLAILRADGPHFHADCAFVAEALIPRSGAANGQYFEQRAQGWLGALLKTLVETEGSASLPRLHRLVNTIEGDTTLWAARLERMLASSFADVRRTAGEMLTKQQDGPKEFGAIMGELYAHLTFMDDPVLGAALENTGGADGLRLEALCDPARVSKVYLNIPAEYLSLWAPLARLFFTVTTLHKSRRPDAPRVTLLVDEAGQLGRFEALLKAFTFGRGAGVRAWAVFQDIGQISRNYGAPALQSFLGSAQMRQFFGVRDYETGMLVSNMLGTETLRYADAARQREAARKRDALAEAILAGDDPFRGNESRRLALRSPGKPVPPPDDPRRGALPAGGPSGQELFHPRRRGLSPQGRKRPDRGAGGGARRWPGGAAHAPGAPQGSQGSQGRERRDGPKRRPVGPGLRTMSRVSDAYRRLQDRGRTEDHGGQRRPATREDLLRLLEDRRNDPPVPGHDHPKPDWVQNPDHAQRVHMRNREDRIRHVTERLTGAAKGFRRDFGHER